MARNKERDKATRHAYYLAHKEDFKRRGKKWRESKGNVQLKIARGLGVSLREAGAVLRQDQHVS